MFINETDFFGVVMNGLTVNITGDLELTLFMVFVLMLMFALSFGIPTEYVIPVLLPFIILLMAFSSNLFVLGGISLFIIILILLRMWFV